MIRDVLDVKGLSQDEETRIRNRLDYIAKGLHRGESTVADLAWSYTAMKRLLFDIYILQDGLIDKEEKDGDG